jgi:hypothetical protein
LKSCHKKLVTLRSVIVICSNVPYVGGENPPANLDKIMDKMNKVAKRTEKLLKLINIFL